jgi:hypothetical protein
VAPVEGRAEIANSLLDSAHDLTHGRKVKEWAPLLEDEVLALASLEEILQVEEKRVEEVEPPLESIDQGGHIYVLVEPENVPNFDWSTLIYKDGYHYHRVTDVGEGSSKTPGPAAGKPDAPKPKEKKKTAKKRKAAAPESNDGGVKLESKPEPVPSSSKGKEKAKDPLAEGENPLRVQGAPRSTVLTDAQKKTLRKALGLLEAPVSPDAWSALSKKEKREERAKRDLPHWAVTAVVRNPDNLAKIVSKELTKDNFNRTVQPKRGKATPQQPVGKNVAEATLAWKKAKDGYPGVGLFARPQSKDGKALKKEYDSLVEKYGKLPCFPKPKKDPSLQGKAAKPRSSPGQGGTGVGALAGTELGQILRLMSDIVRAAKGDLT